MLCFSELGELGVGLGAVLPFAGGVEAWIAKLLQGSAAQPVLIYADSHYATIVRSARVEIDQYELIRGFVPTQSYRSFIHFRFRVDGYETPISIINAHASSSTEQHLRTEKRRQYFSAFAKASAPLRKNIALLTAATKDRTHK